jgi:hypothetical protein
MKSDSKERRRSMEKMTILLSSELRTIWRVSDLRLIEEKIRTCHINYVI